MSIPSHGRKVWAIPCLLAVLTLIGLLSALLGEQIAWKVLCWVFLAVPIMMALWFSGIRPRR